MSGPEYQNAIKSLLLKHGELTARQMLHLIYNEKHPQNANMDRIIAAIRPLRDAGLVVIVRENPGQGRPCVYALTEAGRKETALS